MRIPLFALALALTACGSDRGRSAAARDTGRLASASPRGPDELVLRIPRGGGEARVFA